MSGKLEVALIFFEEEKVKTMRIAICDDQPEELDMLETLIRKYLSEKKLDATVMTFSHPDELLRYCAKDSFHIYILDIVMPMVDGISMGKEIRTFDWEAQIIYTTTEPQFALYAYAANPINYLLKPVDKGKLFETLDLAISRIQISDDNSTISVKTVEGLRVLRFSDIALCEYQNHVVIYTLNNGDIVKSRTIIGKFVDCMAPLLDDKRFIQSHASFIVNMNRIELFAKDSFTLQGGASVPIAAGKYAKVRDTYMDYLMLREIKHCAPSL